MFDIEFVLRRSLVYGSLTVFVLVVYVGVLSLASSVLQQQAGLATSLAATGVVAVLVQPAREVIQRAVNRGLYGQRDDPYTAIRRLSHQLSSTPAAGDVMQAVAEAVARAMRVRHARVDLARGAAFVEAGAFGTQTEESAEVDLTYQGQRVGRLVLSGRRGGEGFSAADRRLMADLARQAATAAHAVLLIEDLQRARARLIAAREEERRVLRRRLHDEVGPALAAIGLKLEAAGSLLETSPEAATRHLAQLEAESQAIVTEVRRLVEQLRGRRTAGHEPSPGRVADSTRAPTDRAHGLAAPAPEAAASRRWTSRAMMVAGLGIVILVLAVAQSSLRWGQVGEGWRFTADSTGWGAVWQFIFREPSTAAASNGFRTGDRLLAIDGRPIEVYLEAVSDSNALRPERWRAGQTVTETVERDGARVDVAVVLAAPTSGDIARRLGEAAAANVGFFLLLVLAGFVLWKRHNDLPAQLLWILSTAIGASLIAETVSGSGTTPADLFDPLAFWSVAALNGLVWVIVVTPVIGHLSLGFPVRARILRDRGRLLMGILYGAGFLITAAVFALSPDLRAAWRAYAITTSLWMFVVLTLAIGRLAWLAIRERDADARSKVRWVAFGFAVNLGVAIPLGLLWFLGVLPAEIGEDITRITVVGIPITFAIAIVRHRLFDIDLVWNRALVYAALTAVIAALYVATVAIAGLVLSRSFAVSLLATGIVAVLMQPFRERIQRAVNRLMYGERDEPYEVASRLGRRLEAAVRPRAVLPAVAETVAQALHLPHVAIELEMGNGIVQVAATVGVAGPEPLRLPIVSQGVTVGHLLLGQRPGAPLGRTDRELLVELAQQTGRVVQIVQLRAALAESRLRIAHARDEERHRIRRDLHDDLGPNLAALAVTLGAARAIAPCDPIRARQLLQGLQASIQRSVSEIRRIVYDLRPPALDELGLVGAIRQQMARLEAGPGNAGTAPPRFTINVAGQLPRLGAAVEVAAYRIVVEAMTNAVRHAAATRCEVRLAVDSPLKLGIEVADNGRGMGHDPRAGIGLESMRERAAELGGAWRIESTEGGVRVIASLPLATTEPLMAAA
ncbi:MAG: hypothetical protein HYX55_05590 [Chloroflexi bacterium]|nr:hypothetical protein [Chloroflexota bacterium]